MLNNIRIVLVHTSHPGNIGAAARAMKNMCLSDLVLVQPGIFPSAEATARASGADDLLARARCCDTLEEAIADCELVIGTSARLRSLAWPEFEPRACAQRVREVSAHAQVALVFGREQSGLSNDELDRCHALVHIPTNPEYSSLNLSQAVQVIAYEVYMAQQGGEWQGSPPEAPGCRADEMERFYAHLEQTMIDLEFYDPANPRQLLRRLRRLFQRVQPDTNEMNILRGILSAAQVKARTSTPRF